MAGTKLYETDVIVVGGGIADVWLRLPLVKTTKRLF